MCRPLPRYQPVPMTDTAVLAAPRLERPRGTAFRGVCMALANATGTDVVLWRVLFVVLIPFGLVTIPLYLLGIFLIPAEGEPTSLAHRLLNGPDRHLSNGQVVFIAVLVLTVVGLLHNGPGTVVLIVAGVLGLLWWRGDQPARTPVAPAAPETPPVSYGTPLPQRPRRPRSPLGGLTTALALVTAAALLLLDSAGTVDVSPEVVLAAALGVVGLGLVVGSFLGRSFGLVLLASALAALLAGTLTVRPVVDAGFGDRTWLPTGAATYKLGAGDATLDLRGVTPGELKAVSIHARVEMGRLLVLLPQNVRVHVRAGTDYGNLSLLGQEEGGRSKVKDFEAGPPGAAGISLDVHVHFGDLVVDYV
jgi:phage shock protein PspC (stress-responsive transcriptional regulator)